MADGIAGGASVWVLGTFALYLIVLIGIGVYSSRLMRTVGDYSIGGRRVGPVVTGFSERASEMSGWLSLGVPADAFGTGIMGIMNAFATIPADLFSWGFIAKRLRKYTEIVNAVTLPTFFENRLQDETGLVKGVSSLVLIIFEGGYVGAQIVAAATLLNVLAGIDMGIGVVVGGVIVVGYTMLGGYFAVAWSDTFQGAIILVAFIVLPIIAFLNYGSPFEELSQISGSMTSITAGTTGLAAVFAVISYLAIGLGWPGNPHIMVRFMGIDRVKNIRYAAVVALLFMFVAYIGAVMIGLYAVTVFGVDGLASADNAMPQLTLELVPGIVAGVILAAALAAMMSSADSQLLIATTAVVEDLYHGFLNQEATEEQLVFYSRIVTLVLGAASITFAYLARGTPIYTLVLDYAWGGLGAALGPMLIAVLWWHKVTAPGAIASMIVGATTMVVWPQWPTILGTALPTANSAPLLHELLTVYGLFPAFILSGVTLIVVSLLTEPPERETVEAQFEVFKKPLSAVTANGGPEYATDGGYIPEEVDPRDIEPKVITEADNIRAHVEENDYWEREQ